MIDKNGNRIVGPVESEDPSFLLNEIRFMMKAFQQDRNDHRALLIAKKIVSYIKISSGSEYVLEYLIQLEMYAAESFDDNFLWQLVYARREFENKTPSHFRSGKEKALKHAKIALKHFRDIVRVNPTVHNCCAEVFEILVFVNRYNKVLTANEIKDYYNEAEQLFNSITQTNKRVYFEAGQYLYQTAVDPDYKLLENNNSELQALMKIIHYSLALYRHYQDIDSLKLAAKVYAICISYKQFSFGDEKSKICQLIEIMEEEIQKGHSQLSEPLETLKKKFSACNNN